ncbi:hypothetical protein [uncultured Microbulbifer sp.]|uniref:hypothetical protein n=1 Tax=uncultured Microbulbifer sp. TaxID=348147 RepID=UPI00260F0CB8|nr:hypothetical protein [uncultured Microbulbifer sp.]
MRSINFFSTILLLSFSLIVTAATDFQVTSQVNNIEIQLTDKESTSTLRVDFGVNDIYLFSLSNNLYSFNVDIDNVQGLAKVEGIEFETGEALVIGKAVREFFKETQHQLELNINELATMKTSENNAAFSYLFKISNFMTSIPLNKKLPFTVERRTSLAWTDLCPLYGQRVTARWDNDFGARSATYIVGGHGFCAGRCGAGCIVFGDPQYTQDCMNHDACADVENQQLGVCADEWSAASDDFLFSPDCPGVN